MYLPMGTGGSWIKLHQAKRPVIVYRSISISAKLICEQQLIPIKPSKESSNSGIDSSISNAHAHTQEHRSCWYTLICMENIHRETEMVKKIPTSLINNTAVCQVYPTDEGRTRDHRQVLLIPRLI